MIVVTSDNLPRNSTLQLQQPDDVSQQVPGIREFANAMIKIHARAQTWDSPLRGYGREDIWMEEQKNIGYFWLKKKKKKSKLARQVETFLLKLFQTLKEKHKIKLFFPFLVSTFTVQYMFSYIILLIEVSVLEVEKVFTSTYLKLIQFKYARSSVA